MMAHVICIMDYSSPDQRRICGETGTKKMGLAGFGVTVPKPFGGIDVLMIRLPCYRARIRDGMGWRIAAAPSSGKLGGWHGWLQDVRE